MANCNHKHGLMSTCSREAALFYPHQSVLMHEGWNGPISRKKYLKIDCSVKMSLQWLIIGVAGT